MSAVSGDHVEAWKAVTDFAKTVISLASGVLTVLIAYYVTSGFVAGDRIVNYAAPALLVLSALFGIFGFGRAIRAISKGVSEVRGIALCNIAVLFLLAGVIASGFVRSDEQFSLVRMISVAKNAVSGPPLSIGDNDLISAELKGRMGVVSYRYRCGTATISISAKEEKVVAVKVPDCQGKGNDGVRN